MRKKFGILVLISIIVSSLFFISTGKKTTAQECNDCDPIPTDPGNADYSQMICECAGAIPTIIASSDEIESGQSITLHIDSGGLACSPYSWQVSGVGYNINKNKTDYALETVTLSAASGSCGIQYAEYATITVTDNCGETYVAAIRADGGSETDWDRKRGGSSGSIILASNDFYIDNIKIHLDIRHTVNYPMGSTVCTSPTLKYPLIDNQDSTLYSEITGVPHYMEKYGVRSASEYHEILAGWWDELIATASVNYGVCYRSGATHSCGILDIQNPCVSGNYNYAIGHGYTMYLWKCN